MSIQSNGLVAAVSAAVVDADDEHRALLQSVVGTARAIFGASASSIFLLDEESGELVFEAVAGEGEEVLVGRRFSASAGIAGWVLASHEPIMVSDLASNPTFSRDVAETTGYVPRALMAAPLMRDEEPMGVLEVLDYNTRLPSSLGAMDLLTMFAHQASVALGIVQRSRAARRALAEDGGQYAELVGVARALSDLDADRRRTGLELLGLIRRLLEPTDT